MKGPSNAKRCRFCGKTGHSILACPSLERERTADAASWALCVIVAVIIQLAVGLLLVPSALADDVAPTAACPTWSPTQMLCLHNYARGQYSLPPLVREPDLYYLAGRKADAIEATGIFAHDPLGVGWDTELRALWTEKAKPWTTWGENIAAGFPTIRATFAAWMLSPGHRANILDPSYRFYGSGLRMLPMARVWAVDFAG